MQIFFKRRQLIIEKKIVVSNSKAKLLRRISRLFFYPDNKRGWIKPAISKALEIISENSIDAIFSSAPLLAIT